LPFLINTFFVMATSPSTTSQRASYQRVAGRPVASISCTRQVKCVPSADDQCGSMRDASQNRPATVASSTTAQNTVSIGFQHARRRPWLAVGVVGLVAVLAACSGGSSSNQQTASTGADTSTTAAPAAVTTTAAPTTTTTLATGPADLGAPSIVAAQTVSAGGAGAIDPTLQAQIADAVHTYVNAASGTPLGTGQAAVLDGVLTAAAAGRLTAASRDALTDEGLPALAGVKADHTNLAIDAFVGPDQSTVVNATIDVAVTATEAGGGAVKIARTGTLTFVNDGGTWRIDAFQLNVERDVP
jgi:hypothetical protein